MLGYRVITRRFLEFLLICALAVFTVNRYAPDIFHGDVILYSVMSLQNVTLFYWEQNRLLNVGPAITSLIRDPAWNLLANFLFPPLIFFWLLRLWSGQVLRLAGRLGEGFGVNALFILQACGWLVVLQDQAIYEVVIWHVEYPLALLLLALGWMACFDWRAGRLLRYAGLVLFLALATGVNFSIVLPALALVVTRVLVHRRVEPECMLFAVVAMASFAAWWAVARAVPGQDTGLYGGLELEVIGSGLLQVLNGLIHWLNELALVAVVLSVIALSVLSRLAGPSAHVDDRRRVNIAAALIALFAMGWLLVFSANAWVAHNGHAMRYFIPVLFALSMLLSIAVARVTISGWWCKSSVVVACALVLSALYRPLVTLGEYAFVRETDRFVDAQRVAVYGGEYSLAWSTVMNAMLRGDEAYGVAGRASGNASALMGYAERVLSDQGVLPIVCIRAPRTDCARDANRYIGGLRVRESQFMAGEVVAWKLLLERGAADGLDIPDASGVSGWALEGSELASQPGLVGWRSEQGVRSTGKAGVLFHGPYRPLDSGTYRLRMTGEIAVAQGASVDVVARVGEVTHASHPLEVGTGVVFDQLVVIPQSERQVEVRVHVGKESRLSISGYALTRIDD